MPKGVMWRQDDLFGALDASNRRRMPPEQDLDALGGRVVAAGPRNLPAAPLMHGTGFFNAVSNLMLGGSVTTMVGRRFDAVELLDTVERFSINSMAIVGDAFAKPILRALDADPGRWDISSLRVIVSSGVIWSRETKDGLLRHNDRLIMVDSLGSSEAIGMATNTTRAGEGAGTARFSLGATTRVVTDDGRDVEPGSGERGRVALRGFTPVGYYKDPEKSAATFQVIDGVRYSIPGDWAEVEPDGTVRLLGRGSQCINTGGEKVYPEEVEEALKLHPSVHDAAVVGVPDDRFGEAITALVEPNPGATADEAELIAHVKEKLAAFKAPKRVLSVSTVARAANGKLDYRQLRSEALARLGLTTQLAAAGSPLHSAGMSPRIDWADYGAVLFDLDGATALACSTLDGPLSASRTAPASAPIAASLAEDYCGARDWQRSEDCFVARVEGGAVPGDDRDQRQQDHRHADEQERVVHGADRVQGRHRERRDDEPRPAQHRQEGADREQRRQAQRCAPVRIRLRREQVVVEEPRDEVARQQPPGCPAASC